MGNATIRSFAPRQECFSHSGTARSYQVVRYSYESSKALYDAFERLKGGRKGAATDEEQDVLRAMLVTAGAGLDASLKQLIKDSLYTLAFVDKAVQGGFEKFVDRALRKGRGELDIDTLLIAQAFTKPLPYMHLSERYIYDLTGSSLQSANQLFSTIKALGLDPIKEVRLHEKKLNQIFETRNKIVHELDIDFTGARRNRVQRKIADMVQMTNELLRLSQRIVELVYEKLPADGS